MNTSDWNDIFYQVENDASSYESKKRTKQSKRKWREIEQIKEKQRLKRELMDLNQYEF